MATRKIGKNLVDEETGEILAASTSPTAEEVIPNWNEYRAALRVFRQEPVTVQFKTNYNHDTDAESLRTSTYITEPSMAQQSQAEEADINTIVNKFIRTGELPQVRMPPLPSDYTVEEFDLANALKMVHDAKESFMALPAKVRKDFDNDPVKFVAYVDHCYERGDLDPLREMGLTVPPKKDPPTLAEEVAKAIVATKEPPAPPGGVSPAPQGGKGAP